MMIYCQNDYVKLFNGDCVDIMNQMIKDNIKVDKIITSPPYNIVRPNSTDRGYDIYKDGMSNDEYCEWLVSIFNLYDKIMNKNGCVIMNLSYGTENTTIMNEAVYKIIKETDFTLADIIVWKKQSATPNNVSSNKMTRICEYIYIYIYIAVKMNLIHLQATKKLFLIVKQDKPFMRTYLIL